jgi:hypothetical protein
MSMKITQYGYSNDPYMDSETAKGNGAYHRLEAGVSCALTDSAKHALGAHHRDWVEIHFIGGGTQVRRYDDRAPEADERVDLYNPGGFQNALGDFADVRLTSAPPGR